MQMWNEQNVHGDLWHNDYVSQLRSAMDKTDFAKSKMVVADGPTDIIGLQGSPGARMRNAPQAPRG